MNHHFPAIYYTNYLYLFDKTIRRLLVRFQKKAAVIFLQAAFIIRLIFNY
jgi:hypothetical protein